MLELRLLLLVVAVSLSGCAEPADDAVLDEGGGQSSFGGDSAINEKVMAQWARSCALCHVNGAGGAPRVGHPDEWAERLTQGQTALLEHTLEGYNSMPPLGYCMDCEEEDLKMLIGFMAQGGDSERL